MFHQPHLLQQQQQPQYISPQVFAQNQHPFPQQQQQSHHHHHRMYSGSGAPQFQQMQQQSQQQQQPPPQQLSPQTLRLQQRRNLVSPYLNAIQHHKQNNSATSFIQQQQQQMLLQQQQQQLQPTQQQWIQQQQQQYQQSQQIFSQFNNHNNSINGAQPTAAAATTRVMLPQQQPPHQLQQLMHKPIPLQKGQIYQLKGAQTITLPPTPSAVPNSLHQQSQQRPQTPISVPIQLQQVLLTPTTTTSQQTHQQSQQEYLHPPSTHSRNNSRSSPLVEEAPALLIELRNLSQNLQSELDSYLLGFQQRKMTSEELLTHKQRFQGKVTEIFTLTSELQENNADTLDSLAIESSYSAEISSHISFIQSSYKQYITRPPTTIVKQQQSAAATPASPIPHLMSPQSLLIPVSSGNNQRNQQETSYFFPHSISLNSQQTQSKKLKQQQQQHLQHANSIDTMQSKNQDQSLTQPTSNKKISDSFLYSPIVKIHQFTQQAGDKNSNFPNQSVHPFSLDQPESSTDKQSITLATPQSLPEVQIARATSPSISQPTLQFNPMTSYEFTQKTQPTNHLAQNLHTSPSEQASYNRAFLSVDDETNTNERVKKSSMAKGSSILGAGKSSASTTPTSQPLKQVKFEPSVNDFKSLESKAYATKINSLMASERYEDVSEYAYSTLNEMDREILKVRNTIEQALASTDLPMTRDLLLEIIEALRVTVRDADIDHSRKAIAKIQKNASRLLGDKSSSYSLYLYLQKITNFLKDREGIVNASQQANEMSLLNRTDHSFWSNNRIDNDDPTQIKPILEKLNTLPSTEQNSNTNRNIPTIVPTPKSSTKINVPPQEKQVSQQQQFPSESADLKNFIRDHLNVPEYVPIKKEFESKSSTLITNTSPHLSQFDLKSQSLLPSRYPATTTSQSTSSKFIPSSTLTPQVAAAAAANATSPPSISPAYTTQITKAGAAIGGSSSYSSAFSKPTMNRTQSQSQLSNNYEFKLNSTAQNIIPNESDTNSTTGVRRYSEKFNLINRKETPPNTYQAEEQETVKRSKAPVHAPEPSSTSTALITTKQSTIAAPSVTMLPPSPAVNQFTKIRPSFANRNSQTEIQAEYANIPSGSKDIAQQLNIQTAQIKSVEIQPVSLNTTTKITTNIEQYLSTKPVTESNNEQYEYKQVPRKIIRSLEQNQIILPIQSPSSSMQAATGGYSRATMNPELESAIKRSEAILAETNAKAEANAQSRRIGSPTSFESNSNALNRQHFLSVQQTELPSNGAWRISPVREAKVEIGTSINAGNALKTNQLESRDYGKSTLPISNYASDIQVNTGVPTTDSIKQLQTLKMKFFEFATSLKDEFPNMHPIHTLLISNLWESTQHMPQSSWREFILSKCNN